MAYVLAHPPLPGRPAVRKPAVIDPTASCATGSSQSVRKDVCSSAGVAEQLGPCAEGTSQALVALDSAAAPLKLQQKLSRRWRKKWAKLFKRKIRKQKLKRVEDELRKALREHQATKTVGEL